MSQIYWSFIIGFLFAWYIRSAISAKKFKKLALQLEDLEKKIKEKTGQHLNR